MKTVGESVVVGAIELPEGDNHLIIEGGNDQAFGSLAVEGFRVVNDNLCEASSRDEIDKICHHNLKTTRDHTLLLLGFKVHTRGGTRAGIHYQRPSSGGREAISLECLRHTGSCRA